MLAAALATIVVPYLHGRWRIVPWLLVAGVCLGRVYVGAHNPLDVVAGCGLGLLIGAAVRGLMGDPVSSAD
jgi:membrane-associated phospholipid phosphatase